MSASTLEKRLEALRKHLSSQLEEMERIGSLYQPGGLVFAPYLSVFLKWT